MNRLIDAYKNVHVLGEEVSHATNVERSIQQLKVFEVKGLGDCYRVSDVMAAISQPARVPYKPHPQDTQSGVDIIDI